MLTVANARAKITKAMDRTASIEVSVSEVFGRVLAEELKSRRTQPPFDVSAMDGYAVRARDIPSVPATLKVVGTAHAGGSYSEILNSGEAVRIFTGAPVPMDADTIVIQEDTTVAGDSVIVNEIEPERHIRSAGLDFSEGDILLKPGHLLTARDAGLIAAMNIPWVMVRQRPRIGILSTGDEIVMPGDPLGRHQIVSANSIALAAAVRVFGGDPVLLGIAPDNRNALSRIAEGAKGIDLLVTTGGASVGDHDLIQEVLGGIGLDIEFWKIAMKPGKPLIFGNFNGTPLLGLPGNPVSTMVCALIFLKPAIETQLGLQTSDGALETVKVTESLRKNGGREDYIRGRLNKSKNGVMQVTPFPIQDSSMMVSLARSDCFIVRKPLASGISAGTSVEILRMPSMLAGY